ncbi:MAG: hypothetical protein RMJ06_00255 [Nitrososphaerota archaeon]|nr:hypothetical protein [Nitrososphaerota archaeon]
MRAILDTSFLLLTFELGRDLLDVISSKLGEHIEPSVVGSTLSELDELSRKRGRRGNLARLALEYAKGLPVLGESGKSYADEELEEVSKKAGYAIITSDSKLFRRLCQRSCRAIYVTRRVEIKICE